MKLEAELREYRHALARGAHHRARDWDERRGLWLTLRGPAGLFGRGEAAPLPGYSRDSFEGAREALARLSAIAPWAGERRREEWSAAVEGAAPGAPPSARSAVETALLEFEARRQEIPLHVLLPRLAPRACGELGPLACAALIELLPEESALEQAERAVQAGFQTLKLKVGRVNAFADELAALGALRRALGDGVRLRLDANGAWTAGEAAERLVALAPFAPEFVEEPTEPGAPRLVAPALPVALDESLSASPELTAGMVLKERLAALVLKPTLLGGLLPCLALAERARDLGLAVVVSHCFESPLGYAAAVELALALGTQPAAHGLGPHPALEIPGQALTPALDGARLVPHGAPGLGLAPSGDTA